MVWKADKGMESGGRDKWKMKSLLAKAGFMGYGDRKQALFASGICQVRRFQDPVPARSPPSAGGPSGKAL
jgi:hypothetical protein